MRLKLKWRERAFIQYINFSRGAVYLSHTHIQPSFVNSPPRIRKRSGYRALTVPMRAAGPRSTEEAREEGKEIIPMTADYDRAINNEGRGRRERIQ